MQTEKLQAAKQDAAGSKVQQDNNNCSNPRTTAPAGQQSHCSPQPYAATDSSRQQQLAKAGRPQTAKCKSRKLHKLKPKNSAAHNYRTNCTPAPPAGAANAAKTAAQRQNSRNQRQPESTRQPTIKPEKPKKPTVLKPSLQAPGTRQQENQSLQAPGTRQAPEHRAANQTCGSKQQTSSRTENCNRLPRNTPRTAHTVADQSPANQNQQISTSSQPAERSKQSNRMSPAIRQLTVESTDNSIQQEMPQSSQYETQTDYQEENRQKAGNTAHRQDIHPRQQATTKQKPAGIIGPDQTQNPVQQSAALEPAPAATSSTNNKHDQRESTSLIPRFRNSDL